MHHLRGTSFALALAALVLCFGIPFLPLPFFNANVSSSYPIDPADLEEQIPPDLGDSDGDGDDEDNQTNNDEEI